MKRFQFKYQQLHLAETILFLRQFATLLQAGVPIIQCCEILRKTTSLLLLQQFIQETILRLTAGHSLSTCLTQYPGDIDLLSIQLIKMGEQTGRIDQQLFLVAKHYEERLQLRQRIIQAITYPCFISIIAFVIVIGMLLFIIPRFAQFYQVSYDTLPLFTRMIFATSFGIRHYWFISLIGLAVSLIYLSHLKSWCYRTINRIPLIKKLNRQWHLIQFLQNLQLGYETGLPITTALALASGDNTILPKDMTTTLLNHIRAGYTLYAALQATSYFPTLVLQMIKIGEESGQLNSMLQKASDFYQNSFTHTLERNMKLLEPLIMLTQGVLIGGLVIGLYLPIFNLGNSL